MIQPIIEVTHLSVRFGEQKALDDISFSLNASDFVGLAGPNGAGKTTLLRAMLGLESPYKGSISIFGNTNDRVPPEHIGYLPQHRSTINHLFPATTEEVIGMAVPKTWTSNKKKESIHAVLDALQIANLKTKQFTDLSGGQKQRVLLARSLVHKPTLLFLDEPSVALDPQARDSFFALLKKLNTDDGMTIVLVTHDTGYIGTYANVLLYIDTTLIYGGDFQKFCQSSAMNAYFGSHDHHIICHQHS